MALAAITFFFALTALAASSVWVTGMRISPGKQTAKLIFNLSSKTPGSVSFSPNDKTLTLVFEKAQLRFRVNNAILRNSVIERISAKPSSDKVIFNITTSGDVTWQTKYIYLKEKPRVQFELTVQAKKETKTLSLKQKIKRAQLARAKDKKKIVVKKETKKRAVKAIGRARWDEHKAKVARNKLQQFVIVVDPGHGGKDPGAVGRTGLKEKHVALSIAKKLAVKLKKIPGVKVVMTRTTDKYVTLRGRLTIARQHDADLFIAVHADAFYKKNIRGASVFALSEHGATSEAARWLARKENHEEVDGIDFSELQDSSKMVRSVILDMAQTVTIRDSLHLGNKVLDALDNVSKLRFNKVEQAPFVVLKSPDIPSILVETGFISNPYEERKLSTSRYQEQIADAIYAGVSSYVRHVRK